MNSQYKEKAVIRIVDDDEGFGDAIRFMLMAGFLLLRNRDFP